MGRVFVIGAPSGTGKTTLLRLLLDKVPRLTFSISHTTRQPRSGEEDGRDYYFMNRPEFERQVAEGGFLEWAEVYGRLYGTSRSEVERAAAAGMDLVLDVDIQGARSLRKALPDAVMILLLPPSWEALESRLRARGSDDEETIRRRLGRAREQLMGYELYNYVVVNDDLARAYRCLEAIVQAERVRLDEQRPAIERLLEGSSSG